MCLLLREPRWFVSFSWNASPTVSSLTTFRASGFHLNVFSSMLSLPPETNLGTFFKLPWHPDCIRLGIYHTVLVLAVYFWIFPSRMWDTASLPICLAHSGCLTYLKAEREEWLREIKQKLTLKKGLVSKICVSCGNILTGVMFYWLFLTKQV